MEICFNFFEGAMKQICVRCKERPMAYPNSSNHWCKVCLEESRKARYDAVKKRNKNLQQNYHGFTNVQYDVLFLEQGANVLSVINNKSSICMLTTTM